MNPVRHVRLALLGTLVAVGTSGPLAVSAGPPVGVWPLAPRPPVVAPFVEPSHRYGAGHRGVDLLGTIGSPVLSSVAGRVRFAGAVAGVPVVSVEHPDGRRTTYQPVAPAVLPGAEVPAGSVLGSLVPVGSHCAPLLCLHWGLHDSVSDRYLDPLTLLRRPRVRLLPVAG